jgi:hypothetical protein
MLPAVGFHMVGKGLHGRFKGTGCAARHQHGNRCQRSDRLTFTAQLPDQRLHGQITGSGLIGMVSGIVIGVIGFAACGINYPIYKKILEKGKAKYAYEIVQLAREIAEE